MLIQTAEHKPVNPFNSLVPGICGSKFKINHFPCHDQSSRKTFLATSPVGLVTDQAH